MGRALSSALLAAGAAALCAASLRTVNAELAFERGLDLARDPEDPPGRDIPGRLEAYAEAARRDPGEGLYVLRLAQVRQQRERIDDARADAAGVRAVRTDFETSARLRPLDSRAWAGVAAAALAMGDLDGAARAAHRAFLTGPRSPGVFAAVIDVGTSIWRVTRDARALREPLLATRAGERMGQAWVLARFGRLVARSDANVVGDVLEAAAWDPQLLLTAASALRASRPDAADALADAARRAPGGPR